MVDALHDLCLGIISITITQNWKITPFKSDGIQVFQITINALILFQLYLFFRNFGNKNFVG
jgi:hypothetical protein